MKIILSLTLILLTAISSYNQIIEVVKVIDGDTVKDSLGVSYRLLGINSPELNEVGGQESKRFLDSIVLNKLVTMGKDYERDTIDIYRRHLCYLFYDSININKLMIEKGKAIFYDKYPFSREKEFYNAQMEFNLKKQVSDTNKIYSPPYQQRLIKIQHIILGTVILLLFGLGLYFYYG